MSNPSAWTGLFYHNDLKSASRQRFRPMIWDPFFLHLSFLKKEFQRVAERPDMRSVLDLGCGGGHHLRLLEGRGIRYLGVDRSAEDPKILQVDLEQDFDLGCFDLIICSEVLEHVLHYQRLIDNAYRHLAPGGVIFVSVPFAHEVHGWGYNDYFRFTDQALRLLLGTQGAVEVRASNSYLGSLVQKLNNLVFYFPVPYVLKLPFFTIVNLITAGGEKIVSGVLRALRTSPQSLFYRLVYSFPLGYVCVVRSDPVAVDELLKPQDLEHGRQG